MSRFFREAARRRNKGARTHGGAKDITVSSCMCELVETAKSLGDDTHVVGTRSKVDSALWSLVSKRE